MKQVYKYQQFQNEPFLPAIPIVLIYKKKVWLLNALVDSGATISVFQSSIARELGIRVEKGKRIELKAAGTRIVAYLHKIKLRFAGKTFPTIIGFSDELLVNYNILGRKGFFDRFRITFDEANKEMTFEISKSS